MIKCWQHGDQCVEPCRHCEREDQELNPPHWDSELSTPAYFMYLEQSKKEIAIKELLQ